MIDLEILEDGKCILNRDVSKGETINYQNSYLKSIDEIKTVKVLEDLKKDDTLQAGHYSDGKVVICENVGSADYLVIKKKI
jgi:hypothetical protein